jgi:2-C-methyl-D-erythritol 2,4-cyclodiphosphate synthase
VHPQGQGLTRVGLGVDAHAFARGRPLVLGGVTIPEAVGLAGHSDADVLSHAIGDALLSAAALSDLGESYPNTPRWRNASSLAILSDIVASLARAGWTIANVDATVVAETPKLAPFRDEMITNVAAALEVPASSVWIKATTTDGLGFVGRAEGIAAIAVALLESS